MDLATAIKSIKLMETNAEKDLLLLPLLPSMKNLSDSRINSISKPIQSIKKPFLSKTFSSSLQQKPQKQMNQNIKSYQNKKPDSIKVRVFGLGPFHNFKLFTNFRKPPLLLMLVQVEQLIEVFFEHVRLQLIRMQDNFRVYIYSIFHFGPHVDYCRTQVVWLQQAEGIFNQGQVQQVHANFFNAGLCLWVFVLQQQSQAVANKFVREDKVAQLEIKSIEDHAFHLQHPRSRIEPLTCPHEGGELGDHDFLVLGSDEQGSNSQELIVMLLHFPLDTVPIHQVDCHHEGFFPQGYAPVEANHPPHQDFSHMWGYFWLVREVVMHMRGELGLLVGVLLDRGEVGCQWPMRIGGLVLLVLTFHWGVFLGVVVGVVGDLGSKPPVVVLTSPLDIHLFLFKYI